MVPTLCSRGMARLNESRIGALLIEPFGSALTKRARASRHAEHGTAVMIGLDADVTVATADGTVTARAILVAPHVAYAATSPGPTLSFSFDPELCRLAASGPVTVLPGRIHAIARAHAASLERGATMASVGEALLDALPRASRVVDRRIARIVEALRDPTGEDRSRAILTAGLSAAHLQALFVRDVGIPMRTYALWRRLLHGLSHVGPLDLTASAYAAGFADLAHFSRTCRRMLGYAPSELRSNLVGA